MFEESLIWLKCDRNITQFNILLISSKHLFDSVDSLQKWHRPNALWRTLISDKDYENAIKYYTEALELNPSNAIYYSNRSLAYLRTECYGYALVDATRALELDKNYIKGYYRRATSNMALGKFKAALKDYETVRLGIFSAL